MILLTVLFALTALLYASVGFGGGSTYNALLVLNGVDFVLLPVIALCCNIIVVAGGTFRFAAAGHVPWRRAWPIFALSVPMAWLGGRLPVSELVFAGLLGGSLLFAGVSLLAPVPSSAMAAVPGHGHGRWTAPAVGGGAGLLAGMVGIGGGIFLAPVLHLARWDRARTIAGTCSVFILVNSIAGLGGQVTKLNDLGRLGELRDFWPLFLAVLLGGQAGSLLGSRNLSSLALRRVTAALILFVAARLMWRAAADALGSGT